VDCATQPISFGTAIRNPYHARLCSSTGILPVIRSPWAGRPCYYDGPSGETLGFGRPMQSERQLLSKAARGCKDSLRRIYEAHKGHLLTLARGMTGDRTTAEDIVHDVFVAFARGLPRLHLNTSLRAYLSVSVCNRVRDLARTEIRRRRDEYPAGREPQEMAAPDTHAAQTELAGRLHAALEQVPPDQREILLLRTQAGLSFKEIARHQGIPVNTAQGRYRYGIDKLRSLVNYFPRWIILMYGGRKHKGKCERIRGGDVSEIGVETQNILDKTRHPGRIHRVPQTSHAALETGLGVLCGSYSQCWASVDTSTSDSAGSKCRG